MQKIKKIRISKSICHSPWRHWHARAMHIAILVFFLLIFINHLIFIQKKRKKLNKQRIFLFFLDVYYILLILQILKERKQ